MAIETVTRYAPEKTFEADCCPCCGSDNAYWGNLKVEAGEARQLGSCRACGAFWQEVYEYKGFEVIEPEGEGD